MIIAHQQHDSSMDKPVLQERGSLHGNFIPTKTRAESPISNCKKIKNGKTKLSES